MTGPVTRALITLEGANGEALASRGLALRWDAEDASAVIRLDGEGAARVTTLIAALPAGKVDLATIQGAAPALRLLLGAERFDGGVCGSELVEISADVPIPALTDIPWEAAARDKNPLPDAQDALFERLLASLPVCRLLPGAPAAIEEDRSRPRLLLVISNPPAIDGGALQVGPLRTACLQVLRDYPVFQIRTIGPKSPWAAVAPMIEHFEPTVLVVVAHGSSNPQGGGPTLAFVREHDEFAVDRVPVAELARSLARNRSCRLVALIACDLVRSSERSGAVELVQQGVPEVVAMQGSVDQLVARSFLARLLGELLAGQTVPLAAAAARRAVRGSPHAIFPTAFRMEGVPQSPGPLSGQSTEYSRALDRLYARVHQPDILAREELETGVRNILVRGGVALVTGGFGNGTSTLLREAIATCLRNLRNRPILYLDHDRRLGREAFAEWVARSVPELTQSRPILRPKSAPDFPVGVPSAEEMGAWGAESDVSLVLDNLPTSLNEIDSGFIEGLIACYQKPDPGATLLLACHGAPPARNVPTAALQVPALSSTEVSEYSERFLPGAKPSEVYERTGGTLLLLDLERRTQGMGAAGQLGESTLHEYLRRLRESLTESAREAAMRLAQFDGAMELALIEEFVTPDLPTAVTELSNSGLAIIFDEQNRDWVTLPKGKRDGFLRDDAERIETSLAQIFAVRYYKDPNDLIQHIAGFGGAGVYLARLQNALALLDRAEISIDIAVQAQGTALSAAELLCLFERALELLGSETVPEISIAAVRAALAVGQPQRAKEWLGSLIEQQAGSLSPEHECEALVLLVIATKDQEQERGIPDILRYRARILDLIAHSGDETGQRWQRVRREAVFDLQPALQFLLREPADKTEQTLAPLVPTFSTDERAQLLATLAEREMREPAAHVRWGRVAEWVTDASEFLGSGADSRTKTYVLYQQAQYLAKRPQPKLDEAWEVYEQARAAGVSAGEPRRQGLALLRLAGLESTQSQLRRDPATWPIGRLQELDRVAERLSKAPEDSLSLRALGRLQRWAAHHDPDSERRRTRFIQAARALAGSPLSAASDKRRFAEVCVEALDAELGPGGRFLAAQRFLGSLRFDISRQLGVVVPMDNPAAARDVIRTSLA